MVNITAKMKRLPIIGVPDGLNTQDFASAILLTQAQDLQNVDLTAIGKVKTRDGTSKLSATEIAGSPTGIHGTHYGQSKHLAAALTDVWKDMDGTPVSIKSSLTNNSETYFSDWDVDSLTYICNGVEQPFTYNGSATAAVTTPSAQWISNPPNQIAPHERRLWSYDFSTGQVCWSKADDGGEWTTVDQTGNHTFGVGGNGTGCISQKGGLVVCKEKAIYKITGKTSVSFQFPTLYNNIGCVAARTLVNIDNRIAFLGKKSGDYGIYIIDDAGGLTHMSHSVTPTLTDNLTEANEALCSAVLYKDKYKLTYPVSGGYRTVNVYYKTGAWEFDNGNHMSSYYVQGKNLYGGSWSNGHNYQVNTGTNDDGTKITSYFKTKNLTFGMPEFKKKLKHLLVWAKASGDYDLLVNFEFDGKTYPKTFKVPLGTKGSVETTRRIVIPLDCEVQGDLINVKFGTDTLDQPFEFYEAAIYYELGQPAIR